MVERKVILINELGLHARAAAKLVHVASSYTCAVTVEHGGREVDAKSILGLLLLAAPVESELLVRCEGGDEESALEAIDELISSRFGELN